VFEQPKTIIIIIIIIIILFHVLIDPDTGTDTIQGYRMSHKFKTLVSIVNKLKHVMVCLEFRSAESLLLKYVR
jgi:hypothetical protein